MIRDPSDGSVREKPVVDATTTGLAPAITKEEKTELKRLESSREWLKEYQSRKYNLQFRPKEDVDHDQRNP